MKVLSFLFLSIAKLTRMHQPFVNTTEPRVTALKEMEQKVDVELKTLLIYYGENPTSPDGMNPEDLFNLILTFSSALKVIVHLRMPFINAHTMVSYALLN